MSKLAYHRRVRCETIPCLCRRAFPNRNPIFIAQSPSGEEEFVAQIASITSSHGARIRSSEVVPCIDLENAICIIFSVHPLAGYWANFRAKTVIWITEPAIPGILAISNRIAANTTPAGSFPASARASAPWTGQSIKFSRKWRGRFQPVLRFSARFAPL
jgi:hypothetical protein